LSSTTQTSFEEVYSLFGELAKKDSVFIKNTKNTEWFRYWELGCGGIYHMGRTRARLKSMYVLPEFRGQGIGLLLTEARIECCLEQGINTIEAHVYNPSCWVRKGFTVEREYNESGWYPKDFYKVVKRFGE
jgi:GNAT superfamily N-acetyltransferase